MYYLDLFTVYKRTKKEDRIILRRSSNRNADMAYKLKLQKSLCFFCGCGIDMMGHLDHLVPIYKGGRNNRANLVASCRGCNLTKSADQIEISNPYTIKDYLKLIKSKEKWDKKLKDKPWLKNHPPKRVRLYGVFKAKYFKEV